MARSVVLDRVRTERGYASKLAKLCGISRNAVWCWKAVPLHHVGKIRDFTGLTLAEINGDLFDDRGNLRHIHRYHEEYGRK